MPYFQVPDCDASATKSIALGAKGNDSAAGYSWHREIRHPPGPAGRGFRRLYLQSVMRPGLLRVVVLAGIVAAGMATLALSARSRLDVQQTPVAGRWYKGNTHTHTLNSDGDSTPDAVVQWYREHGYQFLVLTDHNFLTSVDGLNALHGADEQFLVVKGEEVTDTFSGKQLHINGLDVQARVAPQGGTSVSDVLQRNVNAIRAAQGVPHINHPNFRWSITLDELRQVQNNKLLEIYNGHPQVNNLGGGGVPGLEEVWDAILTSGTLLYGIAVDDAHVFKQPGNPNVAGPGRGWVTVRAPRLEARALLTAHGTRRLLCVERS